MAGRLPNKQRLVCSCRGGGGMKKWPIPRDVTGEGSGAETPNIRYFVAN